MQPEVSCLDRKTANHCLPPSCWESWGAPCVGMCSSSRFRTVVIPGLRPSLLCGLRYEGQLRPPEPSFRRFCLWPLFRSKKKIKTHPSWWEETCAVFTACREMFLFQEWRHCPLWTTVFLREMCVDKKRRAIQPSGWLGGLRSLIWNCKAHSRFSSSRQVFRPPLFPSPLWLLFYCKVDFNTCFYLLFTPTS